MDWHTSLTCAVLPNITSSSPATKLDTTTWNLPKDILLADEHFDRPSAIDLLIGADLFYEILLSNRRTRKGYPVLQETVLGWIVSGKTPAVNPPSNDNGRSGCTKPHHNGRSGCTKPQDDNRRSGCTKPQDNNGRSGCTKPQDNNRRSGCTKPLDNKRSGCTKPQDDNGRSGCTKPQDNNGRSGCTKPLDNKRSGCTKPHNGVKKVVPHNDVKESDCTQRCEESGSSQRREGKWLHTTV